MVLHELALFSGVGMLSEGLRAGLAYLGIKTRTVCHIEREGYAASVLVARMQEGSLDEAPIWSDVCTFDAKRWAGSVDIVVGGFPCTDLSLAGKRAGLDGARSGLFFNILDIADACGAWFLFLENVSGIASATASVMDEAEGALDERAAARVLGELADRGWNAEWLTLSASEVGASHGRARWFCFAWRQLDNTGRVQRRTGHEQDRPGGTEAGQHEAHDRAANGGAELGHTDGIGRWPQSDHQQQPSGLDWRKSPIHGSPIFAPGPADPAWPEIIQQWPYLAPALAGESGSARLNPCFVEFLMGWPIFWTHINVDQTDDQKASAARSTNEWRMLLQMRLSEWFDAPSLGLQQATGSGNHVPVLPRETSRGGNEAETSGMQYLQRTVHANPHKALGHLPETGMQSSQGSRGCREAMGQQTADGSMQLLPNGIHQKATTPDNVRQVVREQVGMAEQAISNRPQRLKCVGNGVVPAQAAVAACVLIARAKGFSK